MKRVLFGSEMCIRDRVDVAYTGQAYVIKAIANFKKLGVTFDYYLAGGGDNTRLLKIAKKLGVEEAVYKRQSLNGTCYKTFLSS